MGIANRIFAWVAALILVLCPVSMSAGWSFDTAFTPEDLDSLLAVDRLPQAPPESWLRIHDMERSAVLASDGRDAAPWAGCRPSATVAERRQALAGLRKKGYRLVAFLRWPADSWSGGVRSAVQDGAARLPRRSAAETGLETLAPPPELGSEQRLETSRSTRRSCANASGHAQRLETSRSTRRSCANASGYAQRLETSRSTRRSCANASGYAQRLGTSRSTSCRAAAANRLPIDLREAYSRCQALSATYGDLIDVWEIDNEPDISFVEENPETYAAFLKACSAGICSGNRKTTVLMAPLALPPGPYFEAFARNGGLHYTAGLNYHYYGYAEDFTGVYRQFEDAAAKCDNPQTADAVFATQFYPNPQGWAEKTLATFDSRKPTQTSASETSRSTLRQTYHSNFSNSALLQTRPLASEEPALVPQGRWLVSPGVTVEESGGLWFFHVASWAPGPLRPAMAELPLPDGWKLPENRVLKFAYRLVPAAVAKQQEVERPVPGRLDISNAESAESVSGPVVASLRRGMRVAPPGAHAPMPVFITEYGYGLLGKAERSTREGRNRQQAWFESVASQINDLGISTAMAFLLRPYLEDGNHEFGLLMDPPAASSPAVDAPFKRVPPSKREAPLDFPLSITASGAPWGRYIVSPALATLLKIGRLSSPPVRMLTPSPVKVVIDFEAGPGLVQSKQSCGYLVSGGSPSGYSASGSLIIYNLDPKPITGELSLSGRCWSLADGEQSAVLSLAPFERREIPVRIAVSRPRYSGWSGSSRDAFREFEPIAAEATFRIGPFQSAIRQEPTQCSPQRAGAGGARSVRGTVRSTSPAPSAMSLSGNPSTPEEPFEPYVRTRNGNLYQTWPRLSAGESWQLYSERGGNFTMAFYGRANLPWRFEDNEPASLVFFFRPQDLPATYEIVAPRVVEYAAP